DARTAVGAVSIVSIPIPPAIPVIVVVAVPAKLLAILARQIAALAILGPGTLDAGDVVSLRRRYRKRGSQNCGCHSDKARMSHDGHSELLSHSYFARPQPRAKTSLRTKRWTRMPVPASSSLPSSQRARGAERARRRS